MRRPSKKRRAAILATKANMRVVVPERLPADAEYRASEDLEMRSIVGGVLVQTRDAVSEAHEPGRRPICRS